MGEKFILAIDDDEDILYTIQQICEYEGWNVLTATNYGEAKDHLRWNAVDLILVDYHMPGMDGIAVVKELRKTNPKIPFIVLTVEEQDSIALKFMQAGATDYALKPVKAIDLISRIKVHLQYQERSKYYQNHAKGISKVTLQTVEKALSNKEAFLSAEEIEGMTGIKIKTLYRYLHYLAKENKVDIEYIYQESGRPKSAYKLKI